jgi:hypothetical protein
MNDSRSIFLPVSLTIKRIDWAVADDSAGCRPFKSIYCCPVGMQNNVARFTIQTVARYDTGVNEFLKKINSK